MKAVVIGAGAGGLATAGLLAKAGWQVELFERHATPGGRAGSWESQGFRFDTGPSWYLMPEVFEHFFELMGERASDHLDLVRLDPAYKVFFDYHAPLTVRGDETHDRALFEAVEPGAGRQLARYLDRAEQTYHTALRNFLYNPFTRPGSVTSREVLGQLPFLARQLLSPIDRYVSRHVTAQPLRQILEYPMVFLGASPYNAPAMYHLMSYLDFRQGVFYPRGGMYSLVTALEGLAHKYGVVTRYGSPVERIIVRHGRARGVVVGGEDIPADLVISNADLHTSETQLLSAGDRTYPEAWWRKRVAGPSALLMYLGVRGSLPELEHHNLLFVQDWQRNFADIFDRKIWPKQPSMYLSRTSATDPSAAPAGHENLFVLVPLPAGTDYDPAQLRVAAAKYFDQLATMIGVPDLRQRLVVERYVGPREFAKQFGAWQGTALGMAHTLRQSAMFRPGARSRRVRGLMYTGAGVQPGIGLPMCLISAELVYKHLTGDGSAGPLKALRPPKGDWRV